ncbi:MAG TPA: class I SAM-dependent methyltransferase [Gemmatimonadaceae bacterium]
MKTVEQVEAENRRKYSGEAYDARTICRPASGDGDDYASRMLRLKLEMVARECPGDVLVDLCCGAGEHLESTSRGRALAVGVDFSVPFLRHAEERRRSREEEEQEGGTIAFVCGNARSIPLADDSADALYSLSSLYYMPKLDEIIGEIARVLRPGGRCVLDLGGKPSLNSIVCAAYPELAVSCHVPVGEMLDACRSHGLEVIEHRRFQLLPMWGDRPWWLKPVLQPSWTRLLAIRVAGRMIDEWVSSLPIVRRFVFRHVLLCEKAGVQRQQS